MSANFNKVILAGNLTRDPELRYTPQGTAIAKISLAINRRWKDQNGQEKEDVTFVEADAFGKQAETIGQYLKKGRPILMEGRLKLDQWTDKTTNKPRSKLGVVLESFQFLGSKPEGGTGTEETGSPGAGPPARPKPRIAPEDLPPPDPAVPPIEEDDVPF